MSALGPNEIAAKIRALQGAGPRIAANASARLRGFPVVRFVANGSALVAIDLIPKYSPAVFGGGISGSWRAALDAASAEELAK